MKFPPITDVRRKRKELDITQAQLAAASGISQSAIAKIEKGTISASYATIVKLFETLEDMKRKDASSTKVIDVATRDVITVQSTDSVHTATDLMKKMGISQLPVFKGDAPVGSISERILMEHINKGTTMNDLSNMSIQKVMGESYPVVSENTPVSNVATLMDNNNAVLVAKKGKIVGMVTAADLLKLI